MFNKPRTATRRRGSDIVHVEEVTAWKLLRRYLVTAGWIGNLVFAVNGIFFGFYYGGFGGIRFFDDMWLLDRIGSFSAMLGLVVGVCIGVICVWALCVIISACTGALVYWMRFKSFPVSPQ